jgi:TRAP transporter TAXI family solute receptor
MMGRIGFFASWVLALTLVGTANAQTINIMTTPPGSFTHSAGSAIAKVIVEKLGLKATVQPAATRAFGAVDAGLAVFSLATASDLPMAFLGEDEYSDQGPRKNLRMAATLMPLWVAMHVRKDSDIHSLKDLKGKRVSSGFHAQKAIARAIEAQLVNAGLTYDDVKQVPAPNVARAAEDFGNGKTDVFFFALGSAAVMEVSSKVGGLRVLPIDDSAEAIARMHKIIPELYVSEVKPGRNMEGITGPTKVATKDEVFFTHAKAPDDIIYKVVKAIYENKPDLVASFAAFRTFTPQRMAMPIREVDFHPGAIKFYKEVGLWPPKR